MAKPQLLWQLSPTSQGLKRLREFSRVPKSRPEKAVYAFQSSYRSNPLLLVGSQPHFSSTNVFCYQHRAFPWSPWVRFSNFPVCHWVIMKWSWLIYLLFIQTTEFQPHVFMVYMVLNYFQILRAYHFNIITIWKLRASIISTSCSYL